MSRHRLFRPRTTHDASRRQLLLVQYVQLIMTRAGPEEHDSASIACQRSSLVSGSFQPTTRPIYDIGPPSLELRNTIFLPRNRIFARYLSEPCPSPKCGSSTYLCRDGALSRSRGGCRWRWRRGVVGCGARSCLRTGALSDAACRWRGLRVARWRGRASVPTRWYAGGLEGGIKARRARGWKAVSGQAPSSKMKASLAALVALAAPLVAAHCPLPSPPLFSLWLTLCVL